MFKKFINRIVFWLSIPKKYRKHLNFWPKAPSNKDIEWANKRIAEYKDGDKRV